MSLLRNIVMVFTFLFTCLFGMLFGIVGSIHAQGFNWQYSSRLPTGYPTLFVGVVGSVMQAQHQASMRYTELLNGKECDCDAVFNRTTSIDWTGGITAEYWLPNANIAVYGILQAEQRSAAFEATGRSLPISPILGGGEFTTKYTLTTKSLNASIEAGLKVKITSLPVFGTLGIQGSSILTKQLEIAENSTNLKFPYSTPNTSTSFVQLNPFLIGGKASIGADLGLTKSVYVSPSLFAAIPFGSVILGGNMWSRLSYGLQVGLLLGFMP
jgi:hypothetical protein